jgi:hypothetical protein
LISCLMKLFQSNLARPKAAKITKASSMGRPAFFNRFPSAEKKP